MSLTQSSIAIALSLLLLLLLTLHVQAAADYLPANCSVVVGDLDPLDFPDTGYVQPANTTILFSYYTPAASTATANYIVTHLATGLIDQPGPIRIRLAITDSDGLLLAQVVQPLTLDSPTIAAGVYTVPLLTPLVLQPSTAYYVVQLVDSDVAINFGGAFTSPFFTNTSYTRGIQSQYDCSDVAYITEEAPVAGLDCDDPPAGPYAPLAPPSAVVGDPQFVGLLGQSYQVHGMDGEVYSIISDRLVQVNARFTFLSSGRCDKDNETGKPLYTCWTHPGSYLTAIGIRTAGGDTVVLTAGKAADGFDSLVVNDQRIATFAADTTKWSMTLSRADPTLPPLTIHRINSRTFTLTNAGLYTLTLQNSDSFINILRVAVSSMTRLVHSERSHGLIGQTWQHRTDGLDVAEVEGRVDDYVEADGDLLGCAFLFNKFDCARAGGGLIGSIDQGDQ